MDLYEVEIIAKMEDVKDLIEEREDKGEEEMESPGKGEEENENETKTSQECETALTSQYETLFLVFVFLFFFVFLSFCLFVFLSFCLFVFSSFRLDRLEYHLRYLINYNPKKNVTELTRDKTNSRDASASKKRILGTIFNPFLS